MRAEIRSHPFATANRWLMGIALGTTAVMTAISGLYSLPLLQAEPTIYMRLVFESIPWWIQLPCLLLYGLCYVRVYLHLKARQFWLVFLLFLTPIGLVWCSFCFVLFTGTFLANLEGHDRAIVEIIALGMCLCHAIWAVLIAYCRLFNQEME